MIRPNIDTTSAMNSYTKKNISIMIGAQEFKRKLVLRPQHENKHNLYRDLQM